MSNVHFKKQIGTFFLLSSCSFTILTGKLFRCLVLVFWKTSPEFCFEIYFYHFIQNICLNFGLNTQKKCIQIHLLRRSRKFHIQCLHQTVYDSLACFRQIKNKLFLQSNNTFNFVDHLPYFENAFQTLVKSSLNHCKQYSFL